MEIISLKLRQLDENYRGKYWHRLWIEVRPANLFFSDSSASLLTISLSHEQDNIADYMSRLDSVHYKVRSAVINGKVTSSKVFAKYGARDVGDGSDPAAQVQVAALPPPFQPGRGDPDIAGPRLEGGLNRVMRSREREESVQEQEQVQAEQQQ